MTENDTPPPVSSVEPPDTTVPAIAYIIATSMGIPADPDSPAWDAARAIAAYLAQARTAGAIDGCLHCYPPQPNEDAEDAA